MYSFEVGQPAPRTSTQAALTMNNKEIEHIKRMTSGATLTKVARETALHQFKDVCHLELNLQVKSFNVLQARHVKQVIDHLKGAGRSDRTLQNMMSHLRTAFEVFDRRKEADAEDMTNVAMGIAGASRKGTHIPLDVEMYLTATELLEIQRPGTAACLRLQKALGLRMEEAIQSDKSLLSWRQEIKLYGTISVHHGTKGGKARTVNLQEPTLKEAAFKAIEHAIGIAHNQENKRLILSVSLAGARKMYARDLSTVGLSGKLASHSARYAWSVERFNAYLSEGCESKEAKSRLSMDLGHGDGREDIISNVYLLSLKGQVAT